MSRNNLQKITFFIFLDESENRQHIPTISLAITFLSDATVDHDKEHGYNFGLFCRIVYTNFYINQLAHFHTPQNKELSACANNRTLLQTYAYFALSAGGS
jgi:hypothetical protein